MANKKKIAFIKTGHFSNINVILLAILQRQFFDYQIDTLDIYDDIADYRDPVNIISCMKTYGMSILLGTRKLKACLVRTPYMFFKVKHHTAQCLEKNQYAFTFQTQSIFDASVPGIPHFVYTDHTNLANLYYPSFNRKHLYPPFWLSLEKSIYQNASLVFTMSRNITKSLIDHYHCRPEKVATVYCGSNISTGAHEEIDDKRFSKKHILFVGVDWERKGGPELLEAFKLVLKIHPDAHLTIVGCSPKLNIDHCHVIGKVPLSTVPQYYKDASVFCLPTRLEPFGIVFLEAFAHRLPIVATKIGALPDIVTDGENGYLVDHNDIKQLSQRLIELLSDPAKCKNFGRNGYLSIRDKYSWEKTGQRIKENIDKLLIKKENS